jgi:hypothetical protein
MIFFWKHHIFEEILDFYIGNRVTFRFTITYADEACIL